MISSMTVTASSARQSMTAHLGDRLPRYARNDGSRYARNDGSRYARNDAADTFVIYPSYF